MQTHALNILQRAEKTLRRAKEILGVVSYREGKAGRRGAGRWLWKLPIADLAKREDKDGQPAVQDGHANQVKADGHLNSEVGAATCKSGVIKPNVQDGHYDAFKTDAFFSRHVIISGSPSVMSTVCSKWADN